MFGYHHLNPWEWWVPIVVGLGAILALGYPSTSTGSPAEGVREGGRASEGTSGNAGMPSENPGAAVPGAGVDRTLTSV